MIIVRCPKLKAPKGGSKTQNGWFLGKSQTDSQTDKRLVLHYLLGGRNNCPCTSNAPFVFHHNPFKKWAANLLCCRRTSCRLVPAANEL